MAVPDSYAQLYFHIAWWFSSHSPGTPVPEWCELTWPISDEQATELIKLYESATGRSVSEPPR